MGMQVQHFIALEIARERVRDAEARARLRWGVEPEPSLERGISWLRGLCLAISRTPSSRHERCRLIERTATQHPGGGLPA